MESNLASYKRANAHLGNQVNEQRKTILQLQEQLKKEAGNPQLTNEQRALKEQLEVHIQTIGGCRGPPRHIYVLSIPMG